MMKNGIVAFLLALFWNIATVSAGCQDVTLTFNLKPKFPYGNSVDYTCGDLDDQDLEDRIKAKLKKLFKDDFDKKAVTLANMKTDGCPEYLCSENPGHKCLPYCLSLSICGLNDLAAFLTLQISDEEVAIIQEEIIDEIRSDMPNCLGIQNQFMIDVYASLI